VRRTKTGPRVRLNADEVQLLGTVALQLDALLSGASETSDDETPPATGEVAPSGVVGRAAAPTSGVPTPDELAELTGLGSEQTEPATPPEDPALHRLLPDAYGDDAAASAEFRRYTEASLRDAKRTDITVVRQALASLEVTGERVLEGDQAESWMRFVTDARLVLATRLGIETGADADLFENLGRVDADDPVISAYAVYEWLGWLLGDLVAAVDIDAH